MAKSDRDIKGDVLKSLRDFFKEQEVGSWKKMFEGDKKEVEEDGEEEEEECYCGKKDCSICGKPKGIMIEETIVAVKPKKK
jgi:hypothetical protein